MKQLLDPIAPNGVIKFISGLQQDSPGGTSAAAFVIGLFGAVWAASGAMTSVIKAVNKAHERQETRPFWKVRAIAILLVVSSGITTAGIFLLIVVGGALGDAISKRAGLRRRFPVDLGHRPLAGRVLRDPPLLRARVLPRTEQGAEKLEVGHARLSRRRRALALLSGLFALYVTFAGNYTKTYGTIASGVILLLWLNYSAFALLFGAELNAELERQADIRAAGGERAGLVKVARRGA